MKIGQLYNIDSVSQVIALGDAALNISQVLKSIDPKIFEKKFSSLAIPQSKITIDNTGGYGRFIESLRVTPVGDFTEGTDYDTGKGKISLSGENSTIAVTPMSGFSEWTDDELNETNYRGRNLVSDFIKAHNSIYANKVDEIALLGNSKNSGLLNNSLYTIDSASGAVGTLTAIQLYSAIDGLIQKQRSAVNGTLEYQCDTVIMPTYVYEKASGTLLDTAGGTKTVLTVLQENRPNVLFLQSARCNNVGGASRTIAFSSNEECMKMRIPLALTFSAVYNRGFKFGIDTKARIAGIDILEKFSGRMLGGL